MVASIRSQVVPTGQAPQLCDTPVAPTRHATQPPVTTKGPSGQRKVGFLLAGLALLVIAAQVVVRLGVLGLGPSPLALLVSVAIVIIGVTIAVRSGQSGTRTGTFVIAMVLGLVAVPWVVPVRHFEEGSSPSSSSPDSQQSQSPSYQAGYDSGASGLARNTYGEEFDTSDVAKSEQYACSVAFTGEQIRNASLTEDDYVQGCLKAFRDHPPATPKSP
jgi:hypothetical protein